jgi:hypothetical protein
MAIATSCIANRIADACVAGIATRHLGQTGSRVDALTSATAGSTLTPATPNPCVSPCPAVPALGHVCSSVRRRRHAKASNTLEVVRAGLLPLGHIALESVGGDLRAEATAARKRYDAK